MASDHLMPRTRLNTAHADEATPGPTHTNDKKHKLGKLASLACWRGLCCWCRCRCVLLSVPGVLLPVVLLPVVLLMPLLLVPLPLLVPLLLVPLLLVPLLLVPLLLVPGAPAPLCRSVSMPTAHAQARRIR
jgi:hypothetical protein